MSEPARPRHADHPIAPLFVERWSPRAMSGEALGDEHLMRLFEAARWAPSANNSQPWRFLYACRDTAHWPLFFELLGDGNKRWCSHAGALIVVLSATHFAHNGKPARLHSFDAGAAWMSLALQGSLDGLVVHGMQGFNDARAREALGVPQDYAVEIMIAVGKPAPRDTLPEDLQAREQASDRRRITDSVRAGLFAF